MRLDHLLSREYSASGNAGAQTEVDTTGAIRIGKKLQESRKRERQRTFETGIAETKARETLYRLQGSLNRNRTRTADGFPSRAPHARAHLDNCTARKDSGKASCNNQKVEVERSSNWSQDQATKKSSYKEHRVDALAPYADEGRGKLRKATGSRKQASIRRYPNGGTRRVKNPAP